MTDHQKRQSRVELDTFGRPVPQASAQSVSVGEDAVDLIVPLLKATLDPASKQAKRPIDSPAGRIVSQVAHRGLDTGGAEGVMNLAVGLTTTLSFMVPAFAQALGRDPNRAGRDLAGALRSKGGNPYVVRIFKSLDTRTPDQAVRVIGEAMAGREGEILDLILQLADHAAIHAEGYAHVTKTPLEEVWAEIEEGLRN